MIRFGLVAAVVLVLASCGSVPGGGATEIDHRLHLVDDLRVDDSGEWVAAVGTLSGVAEPGPVEFGVTFTPIGGSAAPSDLRFVSDEVPLAIDWFPGPQPDLAVALLREDGNERVVELVRARGGSITHRVTVRGDIHAVTGIAVVGESEVVAAVQESRAMTPVLMTVDLATGELRPLGDGIRGTDPVRADTGVAYLDGGELFWYDFIVSETMALDLPGLVVSDIAGWHDGSLVVKAHGTERVNEKAFYAVSLNSQTVTWLADATNLNRPSLASEQGLLVVFRPGSRGSGTPGKLVVVWDSLDER